MEERRLRDFGHRIGALEPGPLDAITDVPGVRVGQTTVRDDAAGIHTGVTAVVPPALPVPAGFHIGNGYGKFVGVTQIMELGEIETPVLLTSTLSVFRAADALLTWALGRAPAVTLNPVVGEVNNGWLSSGDPRAVTDEHVFAALDAACGGPVGMGGVGGGTGACALGFKAGIGTASRRTDVGSVGVLVQANMGGDLRLLGRTVTPESLGLRRAGPAQDRGSCVVVVALETACGPRQLERIAARGVLALGRTGASYSHGSGDYGLAFSAEPSDAPRTLPPAELDAVFTAVLDATEEAVIDALLCAETVRTPDGRVAHALPHEAVEPVG